MTTENMTLANEQPEQEMEGQRLTTVLSDAIQSLLTKQRFHEEQAAQIRTTLRDLRGKLTRGGRAAGQKRGKGKQRRGVPSATAAPAASDPAVQ